MGSSFILPLDSPHATRPAAGGKGADLSRLGAAGFPVPRGFISTTAAYAGPVAATGPDATRAALRAFAADAARVGLAAAISAGGATA